MPYDISVESLHKKELRSGHLKKNLLLYEKCPFFVLEPHFRSLEATYAAHLRLIGKRVVEYLLLVIIELFSVGVTARWYERIAIGSQHFCRWVSLAQNFSYKGTSSTNHLYNFSAESFHTKFVAGSSTNLYIS